jgi:hypothetical protein
MAQVLSGIRRFNNHTEDPITVGQHLLICAELCDDPTALPYVLLHDAHEAYIGDITTPVVQAVDYIFRLFSVGAHQSSCLKSPSLCLKHLKDRLDWAIWLAAGLQLPTEKQQAAVHRADLRALATERRDFMRPPPYPWGKDVETALPDQRNGVHTSRRASYIEQTLYSEWMQHLPVFSDNGIANR